MTAPEYPPHTDRDREIDGMVEVLASTIVGPALYVSAPITSGKRLIDMGGRAEPGSSMPELREVMRANIEHARPIVDALRRTNGTTVIDPTRVGKIEGWTQSDYHVFWARVITRYASRVVFVDGWQYSNGASYEFLVATKLGLETLDERESPLTPAAGIQLIADAIETMRPLHPPTEFLEAVAEELAGHDESAKS